MIFKTLACCLLLANLAIANPVERAVRDADDAGVKLFALIIAGSSTYGNYRHQADICHAYQILKAHGIPDEQIVVMMYDDIAQNPENPNKGVIINHMNGPNVYKGVLKDYTGRDVNPQNFLNVLQGKKDDMNNIGSGKVIESGPNDHVFVNFADHGAPGLVAFPFSVLHARQLNQAIMNMHKQKRYGKMVFYVEACESGSMFHNLLPANINVFATTAANPKQSSYACYYDKDLHTYLGDLYSVNWMENTDKMDIRQETLQAQYRTVKAETNLSQVMEYGDLTMSKMTVGQFQGLKKPMVSSRLPIKSDRIDDAVNSRDVPVFIQMNKLKYAKSQSEKEQIFFELGRILKQRTELITTVRMIFEAATQGRDDVLWESKTELVNFDCYEGAVEIFNEKCYDIARNEYSLAYLHKFVTLCQSQISFEKISAAISKNCKVQISFGTI